jgi:hypothetical protein
MNKQEVKQMIGRSPDYSDALMLRMFFEIGVKRPEKHLGIITSRFKKQLR